MPASPRRLPLTLAVALLALAPATSEASELRKKVDSLANKIVELMKAESQTNVALGEFRGPPDLVTSSGPGLRLLLGEALKKHAVKVELPAVRVEPLAALWVRGEYMVVEDEKREDELIVRLALDVRNKKGKRLGELTEDLIFKNGGNDDIIRLLGLQVDLSKKTKATHEDRNHEIRRQLLNPPLKVDGNKVKTAEASPYAIEVLVRAKDEKEYKAVTPREKKGWAFVDVKKGDEYALRLHNGSKHDIAAQIFIDGLNSFAFYEPAKDRPSSYLIAPGKEREVSGWPRNKDSLNLFSLHDYSSSAAAKGIKGGEKVQTVTVLFRASWTGRNPPPELEGSRVDPTWPEFAPKKPFGVVRTIGPLVAAISIRIEK